MIRWNALLRMYQTKTKFLFTWYPFLICPEIDLLFSCTNGTFWSFKLLSSIFPRKDICFSSHFRHWISAQIPKVWIDYIPNAFRAFFYSFLLESWGNFLLPQCTWRYYNIYMHKNFSRKMLSTRLVLLIEQIITFKTVIPNFIIAFNVFKYNWAMFQYLRLSHILT